MAEVDLRLLVPCVSGQYANALRWYCIIIYIYLHLEEHYVLSQYYLW